MANNYLVMPPSVASKTALQHITVNGRSYSATPGSTLTVPDMDVTTLGANGWTVVALVGTTAQRLAFPAPYQGLFWHDVTLGVLVVHEGTAWRNPNTGSAV